MVLSNDQVRDLIKNPASGGSIRRAVRHEAKIQFHTRPALDRSEASMYLYDYLKWVESILPKDKFIQFEKLLKFPLYTNELAESIGDEFEKVYQAENSSFSYEFTDAAYEADFQAYLNDIAFLPLWKMQSFEAIMKRINSLVVIDLPQNPDDTLPYFFFLDIKCVKDIGIKSDGSVDYLIYEVDKNNIAVYDDRSYRTFQKISGGVWRINLESVHGLGYTPVCFFWSDAVDLSDPIVKRSAFTSSLNNLDWLLYWEVARRALEMYAAYPIYSTYEEKCTYYQMFDSNKITCRDGYLYFPGQDVPSPCPSCEARKFLGPGTLLRVPTPKSKDDMDLRNPVSQLPAETASLEYCDQRKKSLWDEIFSDCAGRGTEVVRSEAINQDQVKASFEAKQNVLLGLAKNLQVSHQFTVDTIGRLRYGTAYIKSNIYYGTQFYIIDENQATDQYKSVKTAGVPMYILGEKRNMMDAIGTRGNHVAIQRNEVLKSLEPWVDLSLSEVKNNGLDVIFPDKFLIKADFNGLIKRFEDEYGSIVEFGSALAYNTKIEKINQILQQYVESERQVSGTSDTTGATGLRQPGQRP